MNLLFILLKNSNPETLEKLYLLSPRGTVGLVWQLMKQQAAKGDYEKEQILANTGISPSHLDKITSELLTKCYQALHGEDIIALLEFLSKRVAFIKLFYNELARQTKILATQGDNAKLMELIKECFRMIHHNMPIMYRDMDASIKLAKLYISVSPVKSKGEATFYMECKLIFERMELALAGANFRNKATAFDRDFEKLGKPMPDFQEDVVFEYYWTRNFFYHAQENYDKALEIALEALSILKKYKGGKHDILILRMELRINELLYYLSRFEEAFDKYDKVIYSDTLRILYDRPYHTTKYIQLGLITGHYEKAEKMMDDKLKVMGNKVEEQIIVRDIITYIKFCLFVDDYAKAWRFLQLGFEKNHKATYFQYEVELRNLQATYFYLMGQEDVALDMCRKNIKFLRNNGYTTTNSDFTYFYILIKAIFEKDTKGFAPRHQKMLDFCQLGSYALYGRLLLKMMKR